MRLLLLPLAITLTVSLVAAVAADPSQIKTAQEILRRDGFFYGDSDGKLDEETSAAIKRFQIRNGLAVTGDLDDTTWGALSRPAEGPGEAASGASPAPSITSAQERARSVVENDKAFLRKEEAAERSEAPPPRPVVTTPVPVRRAQPVTESTGETISAGEIRRFVESYLRAAEASTPDAEISFYADHVDYFDSGRVSQQFVQRDQQRYYRRWPVREFTLLAPPEVVESSDGEVRVAFRIRYRVENGRESAEGRTENIVRLKRFGPELKIVSMRERKLRE